jgi:hypothetical protein
MEQKSSPGEDSSFVLSSLGDPVKKRKEQARQRRIEIHRQYVFQPVSKAA